MNGGSVVQIGGAVRHSPLPPLLNFAHNSDDDDEEDESHNISKDAHSSVIGGFIGEGYLAWRALGATIEVFDAQTCIRQAAWTFGAMLHYTSPVITCVCGIGIGPVTHIVIGVDLGVEQSPQGMVGILSLRRSRIIRAFRFQHKVTNVCMITGGEKIVDPSTLAVELRSCQGLLAVATAHASLYLVDLGLDLGDEITSDEMSPASFVDICVPDTQADLKRNKIISSRSHPILCLSDNMNVGKTFRLLGPDDHILYETPSHYVNITSLMYIPQLASLVVGYSFGSFQLINLNLITIDCASPYEENMPSVFSFAYQEPENDPKSFVYLWVCRSHSSEFDCDNIGYSIERSNCSLYSMHYEKKEWIEGHGLWYQSLLSMSPRFRFKAMGGIGEKVYNSSPSKLISAMSVAGTTPLSNLTMPLSGMADDALALSNEEAEPVPELSLCLFCWEASVLNQGKIVNQHYVAIFDINQWYQSQMPSQLRLEENELCAYMSFHILDKVPSSVDESLLGGMSLRGSWSRHSSRTPCEKMWYPSALSYEFNLLTSESLATYQCPSVQQTTISALLQQGPGTIVHPSSAYKLCIFSGILSNIDTILNGGSSMVSEREHILNTALEYHLLSLLSQCIVEFSEGRFSHLGCTSQLLMDWAWNKLKDIKNASNTLCLPLLSSPADGIGIAPLSLQNLISLHQNFTYLSHLSTILASIRDNAGEITTLGAGELEVRVQTANLLKLYLQVILWFYHCGLLPQYSPEDALEDSSVPFPADLLDDLYEKRRKEMKRSTGSEILLIDSITEDCGRLLAECWDKDRGEGEGTLYPPTSLHSILSMYLLPGIPPHTKHRIVQYLFLDLSSMLSENYSNVLEELVKFPSSFSLSPSLIKLTQAFWLIDNKDFQAGLSVLLDPLVNPNDITQGQHRRIIKGFLYQGEEGHALTYTQIRKPPKSELEDIRLNLTILLANGRIRESFHYQRKHRVASNAKQLLNHMFLGCEQLRRLESVVHLPLSPEEEDCFVSYLKTSKDPSAKDILLIYYLQKSRYTEISSFHESIHKNNAVGSQKRQNARSAIVQGYMSHLPDVRGQLKQSANQKAKPTRAIYSKPQPFSAHIRQACSSSSRLKSPKTKASTLRASHFHSSSGPSKNNFTPYTPFRSKAQRRKAIQSWHEEMGLESPKEITRANEQDITRMVFPSYSTEDGAHTEGLVSTPVASTSAQMEVPLWNRSSNKAREASLLQESITKLMEGVLRKSLNVPASSLSIDKNTSLGNLSISHDVVSLLKTPPVKNNRSTLNISSNSLAETPQSILKVRKILEQSHSVAENESPLPSFPRHRLSARKSSVKKLDTVLESGALTPKQLRFDLPSNRRFSMEEPAEVRDEMVVEDEGERAVLSGQKKRKRGDSPPLLDSLSKVPSPRKPLPRYTSEMASPLHLRFKPSCSNSEEKEVEKDDEELNNSTHSPINKSRCILEAKDLSRRSLHTSKSVAERTKNDSVIKTVGDNDIIDDSSESFLDESFHSVGEYEEFDEGVMNKDSPADGLGSDALPKARLDEKANNYLVSELNVGESRPNASFTKKVVIEEHSEETMVKNDEKFSVSERFDKTLTRVEICSSNVSESDANIVRETLLLSGAKGSGRSLYPNLFKDPSDSILLNTSSVNNIPSIINKHLVVEHNVTNSNHSVNKESLNTLSSKVDFEKGERSENTNFISLEQKNNKDLELKINTEKIAKTLQESVEKDKSFVPNDLMHTDSNSSVNDVLEIDENVESDTSYVLHFSDSENEESEGLERPSEKDKSLSSIDAPSLSKQDTVLVDPSKSLSQADTVLISTRSETLNEVPPTDSKSDWNFSENTESIGAFPSDLESAKPLHLTTQEREMVDEMLKNSSLVLKNASTAFNHLDSVIEKDAKNSVLNKSVVPVLEFSDEENDESEDMCVTANGVSAEVEEDYASDDSDKTVEFNINEFTPMGSRINSDRENPFSIDTETEVVPAPKEVDASIGAVPIAKESEAVFDDISEVVLPAEKVDVFIAKENEAILRDHPEGAPAIEEVDVSDGDMLSSSLHTKQEETLLYLETAPDNNNVQKESVLQTPLKEETILPSTPSRRTRRLSGLSTDAVIETNTPSTPLRRSTRLSVSTPSKIEITPARRRRRTSETSDVAEESSNVYENVKLLSSASSGLELDSYPSVVSDDLKTTEDSQTSVTPSRRRRRISGSSDIEEGTPKVLATSTSRRRRIASGASDTSIASNIVEETTKHKDVTALEERLGVCPVVESRLSIKENVSPTSVTNSDRYAQKQEYNTPVKHQDTPRRRSARISGVKENLGTIIEDAENNKSVTPKKVTPVKLTPKRLKGKSFAQNTTVIEPLLETIKEDSELSTNNNSVENSPPMISPSQHEASLPGTPIAATSIRRSGRKPLYETPQDVTPDRSRATQLPAVDATPVTTSSARRTRRTSGTDTVEQTHTHTSELPKPSELSVLEEVATSVSVSASATSTRRSRKRNVSGSSTTTEVNSSTTVKDDEEGTTVSLNESLAQQVPQTVPIRKTRKLSHSSSATEKSLLADSLVNSEENEDATKMENKKPNYTLISPDETCVNATVRVMRRYSEKHVNASLSNSKHSTTLRRKSLRTLSIPDGFEFPVIETPDEDKRFHRRRMASDVEAASNSPEGASVNMGEEDYDVFEEDQLELPQEEFASSNEKEEVKSSPLPVYELLEGGNDVVHVLPRRVSKVKYRHSYRRSIATMKALNSRKKDTPEAGADERPIKKLKNGLAASQQENEFAERDLKEDSTEKGGSRVKGFLFQNPEVISAAEAVSEVFDQLTKEHERIVSETFVFSPPFSLSENRRKKIRESSRNSRK